MISAKNLRLGIYFTLPALCIIISPIKTSALTAIANCTQLQAMSADLTEDYELSGNVNCAGFDPDLDGKGFIPVGNIGTPFEGSFDGNGYTISNLTIARPAEQRVGLFGHVNGGTYRDVTITGSIEGSRRVGSLIGFSDAAMNLTVIGVRSSVNVRSYGTVAAGLVGQAGSTMNFTDSVYSGNLTNEDEVASPSNTGGLIGYADGILNISSSTVTGNIVASTTDGSISDVGGLVGYVFDVATIATSSFTGNLTLRAQDINYVGGFVGSSIANVEIDNSSTTGNILATAVTSITGIGGLLGNPSGAIANIATSYATGNLTVDAGTDVSSGVGGLVGYGGFVTMADSYKTGRISVTADGNVTGGVGGLVGYDGGGSVTRSYASTTINMEVGGMVNEGVGGLVGFANSAITVSNTFYTGNISATTTAGNISGVAGVIGYINANASTITNSYAVGNIIVRAGDTSNGIAGLVGTAGALGSYTNSFSAMSVSASGVSSTLNTGAFIGSHTGGTITNNFYDKTLSTQSFCTGAGTDPAGCTPIENNSSYFKNNSTNPPLNTWNFTTIWQSAYGQYPSFRAIPSPYGTPDTPPVVEVVVAAAASAAVIGPVWGSAPVFFAPPPQSPQPIQSQGGGGSSLFIKNIQSPGKKNNDIVVIQKILNLDPATQVAKNGLGSIGMETNFYGPATKKAVQKYQLKYKLVKSAKDSGYGIVGPKTRKFMNESVK